MQLSSIMIVITTYTHPAGVFIPSLRHVAYCYKICFFYKKSHHSIAPCISEQTTKMRTILLAACFAIVTFQDFGTSVEVSSKIDLGEIEESGDSVVGGNLNNVGNSSESVPHGRKFPTRNWRHGSGFARSSEPRKRRFFHSHVSDRSKSTLNVLIISLIGVILLLIFENVY